MSVFSNVIKPQGLEPLQFPTKFRSHSRAQSASTTGGHVGADIAVYFSDRVGIGGTVRVSRGSVDVDASDGDTVAIDVGGVQMSGGLRLRF